jgi:hypothetical protein
MLFCTRHFCALVIVICFAANKTYTFDGMLKPRNLKRKFFFTPGTIR